MCFFCFFEAQPFSNQKPSGRLLISLVSPFFRKTATAGAQKIVEMLPVHLFGPVTGVGEASQANFTIFNFTFKVNVFFFIYFSYLLCWILIFTIYQLPEQPPGEQVARCSPLQGWRVVTGRNDWSLSFNGPSLPDEFHTISTRRELAAPFFFQVQSYQMIFEMIFQKQRSFSPPCCLSETRYLADSLSKFLPIFFFFSPLLTLIRDSQRWGRALSLSGRNPIKSFNSLPFRYSDNCGWSVGCSLSLREGPVVCWIREQPVV